MIDFRKAWLPQLVGYAELVADESMLAKAWLEGDRSQTSVIDYTEFFEQVLGDMHAEEVRNSLARHLSGNFHLQRAVDGFICAISQTENWVNEQPSRPTANEVLKSQQWNASQERAVEVLVHARDAGISSSDFNPGNSEDNSRGQNT